MSNYILSCCSTSDLNHAYYEKKNISFICFHFSLGENSYPDDFGVSVPFDRFYSEMGKGVITKTSQVSVGEYMEYFEPFLKEGKDILHVTLSSGLSGTYNSCSTAADLLLEKYPNRKIAIVDSLGASSGYGLLMDHLADLRDEGKSMEELRVIAEDCKLNLNHWFFSTDLTYYVRGGRVSKTSGFIGNMLHICPLLNMNYEGKLIPRFKIVGKKKVIKEIVNKMIECADGGLNYIGKCFISQSACIEDAKAVASLVEENFKKLNGKVEIFDIGTTIGSHTGPGTVALFFFGKKRVD